MSWSPDSKYLSYVNRKNNFIKLWDIENKDTIKIDGKNVDYGYISWSKNGKYIYVGVQGDLYKRIKPFVIVLREIGDELALSMISNRTRGPGEYRLTLEPREGENVEETSRRAGLMGKTFRELGPEIRSYLTGTRRGGKRKQRKTKRRNKNKTKKRRIKFSN
jgi:hypothetical protein